MTDHSANEVLTKLHNLGYDFYRLTSDRDHAELYDMRRDNLGDKALLKAIATYDTLTNLTLTAIKISDDYRITETTLASFDTGKFNRINNNLITVEDLLEALETPKLNHSVMAA